MTGNIWLPQRPQGATGGLAQLERTLVRFHSVLLLSFGLFVLVPGLGSNHRAQHELLAHVLISFVHFAIAVDLLFRGERPAQLFAFLLTLTLIPHLHAHPVPGEISIGVSLAAFAFSAVRLLAPRWLPIAGALAIGVYLLGCQLSGIRPIQPSLDHVLLTAALVLAAKSFFDALEHGTLTAIWADGAARAQRTVVAHREAENRAVHNARRVLHDDVLTVLRSISEGAESRPAHHDVRELCRETVQRVEEVMSPR